MADPSSDNGAPRWVKILGIIAVVLVLLFAVVQFTGIGGSHGPGRHASSGDVGGKMWPGLVEVRAPSESSHG